MILSGDALAILLGALLIDAAFGDPDRIWRRWPHPVVLFGRAIAAGDRHLNREAWSGGARRAAGALLVGLLLGAASLAGWIAHALLALLPGGGIAEAFVASVFLAQRGLHDHVGRVRTAFADGLPAARRAVSMIVGRDPERLDEAGICRAAIESAAENFSDGVVAPAFWFAVAGLPGLLAYKALNTADSMIGHLSVRHRDFGWAAARLDDAANLLPARLSALLLAGAAPLAGGRPGRAIDVALRDARLHGSPNAGWPEAAMAGALDLALAGPRVYAAGPVAEPYLNAEGRRDAAPGDIGRALRVLGGAAALHGAAYALLWSLA